jgi:hypothetical protein
MRARERRLNMRLCKGVEKSTVNNNGQLLIDFCNQQKLRIMNGCFAHKDIHTYTRFQDARNLRSVIDCVIIKQRNKTDCWMYEHTGEYGVEVTSIW